MAKDKNILKLATLINDYAFGDYLFTEWLAICERINIHKSAEFKKKKVQIQKLQKRRQTKISNFKRQVGITDAELFAFKAPLQSRCKKCGSKKFPDPFDMICPYSIQTFCPKCENDLPAILKITTKKLRALGFVRAAMKWASKRIVKDISNPYLTDFLALNSGLSAKPVDLVLFIYDSGICLSELV